MLSPGAALPSWGGDIPKPPFSERPHGQSWGGCGFHRGNSPLFFLPAGAVVLGRAR